MGIRFRLDIKARHIEEVYEARAEKLKDATHLAKLLGYKRVTWATLRKLGYDIKALGYQPPIQIRR